MSQSNFYNLTHPVIVPFIIYLHQAAAGHDELFEIGIQKATKIVEAFLCESGSNKRHGFWGSFLLKSTYLNRENETVQHHSVFLNNGRIVDEFQHPIHKRIQERNRVRTHGLVQLGKTQ